MMAEEEMIFADRLFDARTKELCDIKYKTHELRRKFNAMYEYDAAWLPVVREFIGDIVMLQRLAVAAKTLAPDARNIL